MNNSYLMAVAHLLVDKHNSAEKKDTLRSFTRILTSSLDNNWVNKMRGTWMFGQFFLMAVILLISFTPDQR